MPSRARSLADDLRRRSDDELVDLLRRRPDLARPAPADVTTLAARATTRASIQRALDGLDQAHLHALEAVVAASGADLATLAGLLGQPARSPRVRELIDDLCALALCWRSPDGVRAARPVAETVGTPAGLGPVLPGTPQGPSLHHLIDTAPPRGRAVLDALTWGPPTGVLSAAAGTDSAVAEAGRALVEQGLLHRTDDTHVVLPRQVGLALRHGVLHRHPSLSPPVPEARLVDADVVDATAGGRAAELIVLAAEVVDEWGDRPPRLLRTGGVAVRDLGRLAAHLEIGTDEAGWLLETMLAADLIATSDDADAAWMPTGAADDWAERSAGHRWATLAHAWLTMPAAPALIGATDAGRVNALSTQTSWPPGRQRRHDALTAMATLPVGSAPDGEALADLVRWHHPVRMSRTDRGEVQAPLREAEWAGMTGRGALSGPGRRLLDGEREAAATVMDAHVPPPVDHVLLQADLTAVAPGRLDGAARTVMRLVSDVESRGGATVHRVTEETVRRALDTGLPADRLLAEVAAISRTGIPQPLEYLVRDVARRHGVARVGAATAYLRSDDTALLDRMEADRELGLLQLERIAPTVLISPVGAGTMLDLLRERQYGPVAEGAVAGGAAAGTARHHRTSRRRASPVTVTSLDDEVAGRIISAMRTGEIARTRGIGEQTRGGLPTRTEPVVTAALLREAAADSLPVWIGYADDAGGVAPLLLRPVAVEGGRVRGTVADQDAPRTFSLHRITGVRPAE